MCSHFPTDLPTVRHGPVGQSLGGAVRGSPCGLRWGVGGPGRTKSKAHGRMTPAPCREWSSGADRSGGFAAPGEGRFPLM